MSDESRFERALERARRAIAERPPLTSEELEAGWREDPVSGLRWNVVTGDWDDSGFVHVAPRRPGKAKRVEP